MFDPYHKWLQIPPTRRPPTHYDLLGIAVSETDREVIDEALLMRMKHVRKYQQGPHGEECARLLQEIATATEVILDPERRRAYDKSIGVGSPPKPPIPKLSSHILLIMGGCGIALISIVAVWMLSSKSPIIEKPMVPSPETTTKSPSGAVPENAVDLSLVDAALQSWPTELAAIVAEDPAPFASVEQWRSVLKKRVAQGENAIRTALASALRAASLSDGEKERHEAAYLRKIQEVIVDAANQPEIAALGRDLENLEEVISGSDQSLSSSMVARLEAWTRNKNEDLARKAFFGRAGHGDATSIAYCQRLLKEEKGTSEELATAAFLMLTYGSASDVAAVQAVILGDKDRIATWATTWLSRADGINKMIHSAKAWQPILAAMAMKIPEPSALKLFKAEFEAAPKALTAADLRMRCENGPLRRSTNDVLEILFESPSDVSVPLVSELVVLNNIDCERFTPERLKSMEFAVMPTQPVELRACATRFASRLLMKGSDAQRSWSVKLLDASESWEPGQVASDLPSDVKKRTEVLDALLACRSDRARRVIGELLNDPSLLDAAGIRTTAIAPQVLDDEDMREKLLPLLLSPVPTLEQEKAWLPLPRQVFALDQYLGNKAGTRMRELFEDLAAYEVTLVKLAGTLDPKWISSGSNKKFFTPDKVESVMRALEEARRLIPHRFTSTESITIEYTRFAQDDSMPGLVRQSLQNFLQALDAGRKMQPVFDDHFKFARSLENWKEMEGRRYALSSDDVKTLTSLREDFRSLNLSGPDVLDDQAEPASDKKPTSEREGNATKRKRPNAKDR